ncbi:hypothetical protein C1645_743887 [Glomus cerebriforme]|uniref:Uncharacterized protein n=1 Tax=Glomus cerebriforme TaxID=658196 RepID=A0A397S7F8_9GLOM|nr:hypothetical protein C1645_743887 [Glomus cerebriforme]
MIQTSLSVFGLILKSSPSSSVQNGKENGSPSSSVWNRRKNSFLNSLVWNRRKKIQLWEFRIGKETFSSGNSESEKKHSVLGIQNRKRNKRSNRTFLFFVDLALRIRDWNYSAPEIQNRKRNKRSNRPFLLFCSLLLKLSLV